MTRVFRRILGNRIHSILAVCLTVAGLVLSGGVVQADDLKYQRPPEEIAELIEAPQAPAVSISPDKKWMLLLERPGYKSIEEVAQPELKLAGLRMNPNTFGPSRSSYYSGLVWRKIASKNEIRVEDVAPGTRIDRVRWSPDGETVSFCVTDENGISLWMTKPGEATAWRCSDLYLNATLADPYSWLDDETVVGLFVPTPRPEAPEISGVPEGPIVQESKGRKAAARTYQDLLKTPADEQLFEHYTTSVVWTYSLDGDVTKIGEAASYRTMAPSPDGNYLLVRQVHRPFSYMVPYYRFPHKVEVWDRTGQLVREVDDAPLFEEVPIAYGSVVTGPRYFSWRQDAPATLCWTEAQDNGDAGIEAEWRDQLYLLGAPFDGDPIPWVKLKLRYSGVTWGSDDLAVVEEYWWADRTERRWFARPGDPSAEAKMWLERDYQDRYSDPGNPVTDRNEFGRNSILTAQKGTVMYLTGSGASPEGDRPFLDEYYIKQDRTDRLFHSEAPYYEYAVKFLDAKKLQLLTRRESIEEPPNYFVRDLKKNKIDALTEFPHPTPSLLGVSKELIKYKREDGLDLSGTLYLPKGYKPEDGPLPTIFWAYPNEYKSASAAGQVKGSPYRFVRVFWASPLLWLNRGYAVIDRPSMPIVGEGDKEPNDSFREQLVSGAQAAIDELVRRGVCDPERVAVGGHSYGAFMTANLLAHSDIFRAGIARSGAYNRTLTPFGFQSEERTFWDAPEIYFGMSPFMHAEKIDEPILLIHGAMDNNSGTFPLQSERFYGALKGLGATTRLVMLPHESHSYRAMESLLHQAWEIDNWMETYVKNAEPRKVVETPTESGAGQSN